MKKLIAMLLCLVMVLSLAACGQDGDTSNTKPKDKPKVETLSPDAEPSDEEWYQIRKYNGIADALNHFEDEESFKYNDSESGVKYYGQEALAFCYEQLQLLSGLEKWNNTKWAADYGVSIDCQSLMERFTVSDMIKETYTEYDKLGNVGMQSDGGLWVYDTEGRMALAMPGYYWDTLLNDSTPFAFANEGISGWTSHPVHYIYNDNGVIEKYQIIDDGQITAVITPEYDANGVMVSATIADNSDVEDKKLTFIYDAQGRYDKVTYVEADYPNGDAQGNGKQYEIINVWTFTYDDEGKILKKNCDSKRTDYNYIDGRVTSTSDFTTDYTFQYDYNGFLLSARAEETYKSGAGGESRSYEYTCDALGRPCKVVIRDDRGDLDRVEVVVEYGSYYIYNPAK